jgi:hypothetical protein
MKRLPEACRGIPPYPLAWPGNELQISDPYQMSSSATRISNLRSVFGVYSVINA